MSSIILVFFTCRHTFRIERFARRYRLVKGAEDWRQGYTMIAAAVFVASLFGVNEDVNTSGIFTLFAFVIIGLGVTSEGVI